MESATQAGGTNLKPKDIGGKSIVAELLSAGYLEEVKVGKSKGLCITKKGKTAYEHEKSPQRVEAREKARQHLAMVQFLTTIEKSGKISGGDKKKIPESIVEEAKARRLVTPGKKADSYELLLGGETILFAEKPLEEQVTSLKKTNEQLVARVEGAQQKAKEGLDSIQGEGVPELKSAFATMEEHGKKAAEEFQRVLDEIAAFSTITGAAVRFQSALEETRNSAVRQLQMETKQSKTPRSPIETDDRH